MNCNKTNRDVLIDKYIRNELSAKEADHFEEHLLSCSVCRNELTRREEIVKAIWKLAAEDTFQSGGQREYLTKKRLNISWYIIAAAGVALLVGFFILLDRDTPSGSPQIISQENLTDTTKAHQLASDDVSDKPEKSGDESIIAFETKTASLTDYQIYPVYESLIGISRRSGYMKVISPQDSIVCESGSTIEIEFHNTGSDSLSLVLLNNQGEILRENRIASPHKLHMKLPKGLYYWQLTDKEESLHTAKIYIR